MVQGIAVAELRKQRGLDNLIEVPEVPCTCSHLPVEHSAWGAVTFDASLIGCKAPLCPCKADSPRATGGVVRWILPPHIGADGKAVEVVCEACGDPAALHNSLGCRVERLPGAMDMGRRICGCKLSPYDISRQTVPVLLKPAEAISSPPGYPEETIAKLNRGLPHHGDQHTHPYGCRRIQINIDPAEYVWHKVSPCTLEHMNRLGARAEAMAIFPTAGNAAAKDVLDAAKAVVAADEALTAADEALTAAKGRLVTALARLEALGG